MEFRCSGLARVMACPGSAFFTDLPKQEETEAAREGTAFGEYCEVALTGTRKLGVGDTAKNGYRIDGDMAFFASPLLQNIEGLANDEISCEQRIDWQTHSGIWIKGSYDVSFESDDCLYIDDFKYGWGLVEVKENWQLLGYAIGEVLRRQRAYKEIVLRIHQPRPHHEDGTTREWRLTMQQLNGYKERIERHMRDIANGLRDLVAQRTCRYCPAVTVCPAQGKTFYRSVETSQEFVQDHLDEKELAAQLELAERAAEQIKIRFDSLKDLAINRIKSGVVIPGYVLQESYGDRAWKKDIDPDVVAALSGGVDITERKVVSPAQAEKLGVDKKIVKALVTRHFLGNKLKRQDNVKAAEKVFG